MIKLNKRQEEILKNLEFGKEFSISEIEKFLINTDEISVATLRRDLVVLVEEKYIEMSGERKGSVYRLTGFGLIHKPFLVSEYFQDTNLRDKIIKSYNFNLFDILENEEIFTNEEKEHLENATKIFKEKGIGTSETIVKKELERFVIELSWKSSKIEGNTYTLLDTEKLIREGKEAEGHAKAEAIMILNHKKSFTYILESLKLGKNLQNFRELENIHKLLVEDLGINHGLRKNSVGVTGTKYLPLGVGQVIEDEVKRFVNLIESKKDFFSKSLLSILGISYLQAFEDGNKRTGRLFANAMLLSGGLAPLSYRDVDEKKYREAVLIFYEQNSVEAFKKIFVEQYIFSCNTYNLG